MNESSTRSTLRDLGLPSVARIFVVTFGFAAIGTVVSVAFAAPPSPPPEAIAACASSKEGDTCTVTFGSESVSGTCTKAGDVLACRPDHMPPPPKEAVDACASVNEGDACTMMRGSHTLSGTCTRGPSDVLSCRPGPPPSEP